ncbi:MAG: hypothetical protein AAB424_00460 [Patescibacteria group bacterium]
MSEVKTLAGNVGILTTRMNELSSNVNVLSTHVNDLATHVDDLATHMDERFDQVYKRFAHIESSMVTKDYLDDKIGSLRGELVVLTRREDAKLASLVEELYSEESLSASGRKTVLGMEPFARRV